jgi:mono/diheme cytochrome c family protein
MALALLLVGCRQDMHDQPKLEPLEASTLFGNGSGSRPTVEGTVARGQLREDQLLYTGRTAEDQFATDLPMPLTRELLERGQSRFDAFCSPCHGRVGDGMGMIVQRGFKRPNSFHDQRLVDSPVGYYFNVITNGFSQMSSYAAQIPPNDRWAIAAYIKALQLSQSVSVERLSAADREKVLSASESPAEMPEEAH